MKKSILAAALLSIGVASSSQAASFLNGGFEDGTTTGWSLGSGSISGVYTGTISGELALNPSSYIGNTSRWEGTVTSAGVDPITGLSTVRYGDHSVRVNSSANNTSVNVIQQTVLDYDGTSINFAWAAVLEQSHGLRDSDIFGLQVIDLTTSTTIYNATYSSATAPGLFQTTYNAGLWYYNDWTEVSLNVTQGNDFMVSLLAADCPWGAHAGYVYLDGFGTVQGGGGDNGTGGGTGGGTNVSEPGSLALLALGLGALGLRRRKQV